MNTITEPANQSVDSWLGTMRATNRQAILDIESKVQQLEADLIQFTGIENVGHDANRDFAGTLFLNINSLNRRLVKTANALQSLYNL